MEIYSAKEKDDILSQIISKDYISIDSNKGMSIIDEFLFPMGLIEKPLKLSMPDHYICVSTQKGKDFMIKGGFKALKEEQDKEDHQRKEIERLTVENLNLQNEELKYKEKIRHQERIIRLHKYLEALSWIISLIMTSFLIWSKH